VASETLRVLSGDAAGTDVPLDGEFVVGRGETGAGNLAADTEISRRHARFRRTDDGRVVVEDLGSTNGTYVNGRRVTGPTVLSSGDEITLGRTLVRFDGGAERTRVGVPVQPTTAGAPVAVAAAGQAAQPAAPAPPAPPAPPPASPGRSGNGDLPRAGGPISDRPGLAATTGLRLQGIFWDLVILLVAAGAVWAITAAANAGNNGARASIADNCGADIGKSGAVAYVSYVESNLANSENNSVLAIPYRAGDLKPIGLSQCYTGGSGATQLKMPGVVDGNDQIVVNPQHTLLFAVNQGSDSIAVFQILHNGGLKHVDGSPFPSNGKAPTSLGLSGDTLVVANRARDGVRDLETVAPNYTSFKVGADGRLTPVPGSNIQAAPASAPTAAYVPPQGGVAFGPSDGGPIRGFSISPSGVLTQAPGSPYSAPASVYGPNYDPTKEFALGVGAHPTKPYVYMPLPTVPALAVYSYDKSGSLKFLNAVPTVGAFLPCWIQITKDGRWLYTTSAATNTVTVFDITQPAKPVEIQNAGYMTPGNAWNIALDPTDKYLFVLSTRAVAGVPPGKANIQHVMKIGPDGRLTEVNPDSANKLPLPPDATPFGNVVITPGA
jgi:hypothetical protein